MKIGDLLLREGDWLSLDGLSGQVFACKVPLRAASLHNATLHEFLGWAKCASLTPIRANADTPEDAERARRAGATGIGLCRTEHMFFAPERLEWIRAMILTEDRDQRQQALNHLLPMQKADFEALFRSMDGLPVTIRLIDPPLHEFLPRLEEIDERLRRARQRGLHVGEIAALERLRARTRDLQETNPMMGHRGCRLGITHPEIIVMQVRAILEAAIAVQRKGVRTVPEIMVPLVAGVEEVRAMRKLVDETAEAVFAELRHSTLYKFGAMIELPRAAVCAGSIAKEVDFLSFGTNDLTQMTFGFSRDDARKYLDAYIEAGHPEEGPLHHTGPRRRGSADADGDRAGAPRPTRRSRSVSAANTAAIRSLSNFCRRSSWTMSPVRRRVFLRRSWQSRRLASAMTRMPPHSCQWRHARKPSESRCRDSRPDLLREDFSASSDASHPRSAWTWKWT